MNSKEIEIPVPWGSVAGKAWGLESNAIILIIHGGVDNAGSFDRLIPHLSSIYFYICIDLPGHGRSTHFPKNVPVQYLDYVLTVKIVVDYLNTEKIILFAHSIGSFYAILFSQLYPKRVSKLILIEGASNPPYFVETFIKYSRSYMDRAIRALKDDPVREAQSFTYEEGVDYVIAKRKYSELTPAPAEDIFNRCSVPNGDGRYKMSNDARLKAHYYECIDANTLKTLVKKCPVTCPILRIVADASPIDDGLEYTSFLTLLGKTHPKCITRTVSGDHHVHANNPEIVAPIINSFLACSKL